MLGPACGIDVSELEVSLAPERGTCWGCLLNDAQCMPILVPGHLSPAEGQFCERCRDGIRVPLARVRALSAEQAASLVGKCSGGFWNHAPPGMGGGEYRILNNTDGCVGPRLALFREQPPHLHWSATSRSNPSSRPPRPSRRARETCSLAPDRLSLREQPHCASRHPRPSPEPPTPDADADPGTVPPNPPLVHSWLQPPHHLPP